MPFAETNGVRTYYRAEGDGRPLVFVHGAFLDGRMWAPQMERFAARYRTVAYDLRGHGRTGPSPTKTYTAALFAGDLLALLDRLRIERAVVCGLSLGGMVAQAFAAAHPERLRALVLCDTAVSVTLTLGDKLQRYVLFPRWALRATLGLLGARRFTDLTLRAADRMRSAAWLGQDAATRRYVVEAMRAMAPAEYGKVYELLYGFQAQRLDGVAAPALVLYGEHESRSVKRHAEVLVRRLPQAERVAIPEAGHLPNLEQPDAFNGTLASWLDRLA